MSQSRDNERGAQALDLPPGRELDWRCAKWLGISRERFDRHYNNPTGFFCYSTNVRAAGPLLKRIPEQVTGTCYGGLMLDMTTERIDGVSDAHAIALAAALMAERGHKPRGGK